jgi:hypothetical protein
MRPDGITPAAQVLADSWGWTAVVVVAAVAGVALSVAARRSRTGPQVGLIAALAAAALLAPAEQARIHTIVSLNKHVDFGAWLAAIAAGYALAHVAAWLRPRYARVLVTAGLTGALVPVAVTGAGQAQAMTTWPGAARLAAFLAPRTAHGGRFLAETDDVLEYYLPRTSWRQWSNTASITLPSGRFQNAIGDPARYAAAIRSHYFSLVILSFSETGPMDQAIEGELRANPDYKIIKSIPWGGATLGDYIIWQYQPSPHQPSPNQPSPPNGTAQ